MSAVGAMNRLADSGAVVLQVLKGDQAVVTFHFLDDELRGLALIEAIDALIGNTLKGVGKLRLPKSLAWLPRRTVLFIEGCESCRPALQSFPRLFQALGEACGYNKAFPRQFDRRGQGLFQRHRAVAFKGHRQAGDGAGHAGRLVGETAAILDHVAIVVLEHGFGGSGRCFLPIVDGLNRFAVARSVEHKPAAADVARARLGDRQGESRRNGGIHRIAAILQHVQCDFRCQGVAGGYHAVPGLYRVVALSFQNGLCGHRL